MYPDVKRRRVNRGGNLAIGDVVGRDALIASLWRTLEQQSVLLEAERRMGKSSIARKMQAEPIKGALAIHRNLENVATPAEFVERIWEDVAQYLPGLVQAGGLLRKVISSVGEAEFGGPVKVKMPKVPPPQWKVLLERTMVALTENNDGRLIVFLWDEMPLMLDKFKRQDAKAGEATAMEMLDELRHLRQTHTGIRMVYTGSIGLHHVISALRRDEYGNDPTNDMLSVNVPALTPEDARRLALSLLLGELENRVAFSDADALAVRIAVAVDGIPFFIHHVVGHFADQISQYSTLSSEQVDDAVSDCLTNPQDPWKLRHYRERINKHYLPEEKTLALHLLDALAISPKPLSFSDLFNRVKAKTATEDEEAIRGVITLLQQDHYVAQGREGTYSFHFPLIAASWRFQRGLPLEGASS